MKKKLSIMLIISMILLSFSGCSLPEKGEEEAVGSSGKIVVSVSFNPLAEFAEAIGGDKVEIHTIIPQGTEPHDFEIKAKDLKILAKSSVFIYNGLGMEPWAEKAVDVVGNKNIIIVVASDKCELIKNMEADTIKERGQYDPHTWLSLKMAKIEAFNIKEALVKADNKNKLYYENNFIAFCSSLDSLYSEYKSKLDKLNNKNFVTGHAAFAYLCRDFGLKQSSVENVFAEGEPTAKKIQYLVKYCKENNVNTIFVEELASPKVSETLANEINAKVKKIYTLESKEDNKNYIESMKDNLNSIYESLK